MKRAFAWLVVGMAGVSFAGCSRIQTRIVENPRVDQELRGNKGYLQGSGPAAGPRSATRQTVETNVELPTWQELNPWRKEKPEAAAPEAPSAPAAIPADEQEEYSIPPAAETPSSHAVFAPAGVGTEYTVQKGDTLQKIAKKFYGNSTKWYRIYKANKDVLKSPDRIRPGQKITIPPAGEEAPAPEPSGRGDNEYK